MSQSLGRQVGLLMTTKHWGLILLLSLSGAASADDGYVTVDDGLEHPDTLQQDPPVTPIPGTPVYQASECIGAVVAGVCHGSVVPDGVPQRCYGQMINGQCTGPQF